MIDFHTHILPKVDDGSRSLEQSLAMLNELKKQGVKKLVATPHFYANDESVESFLERRNRVYAELKEFSVNGAEYSIKAVYEKNGLYIVEYNLNGQTKTMLMSFESKSSSYEFAIAK